MAKLVLNINATALIDNKETTFTKEVTLDFKELKNSESKITLEVTLSSETVTVDKNINAKGKILENGFDLLPTGAIIMWNGPKIPNGWALCDGEGGTPDLRGRFIIGATKSTNNSNKNIPIDVVIDTRGGKAQIEYKKAISGSGLDMGKEAYIHELNTENCPPYYALYFIIKK